MSNDHRTIASNTIITHLRPAGVDPVFDRGSLYSYQSGKWTLVHPIAIRQKIGQVVPSYDQKGIVGIEKLINDICARPGYFDAASTSAQVFSDCTADVSSSGFRLRGHSPEDRARFWHPFVCPIAVRQEIDEEYGFTPTDFVEYEGVHPELYLLMEQGVGVGKARLLRQFLGAMLLGIACRYKKGMLLRGGKHGAKSQWLDLIGGIACPNGIPSYITDGWISSIFPSDIAERFQGAALAISRLNAVDDLPRKELIDCGVLKSAISGGLLQFEMKHRDPFNVRPRAAWIVATNHSLVVDDPALVDRWHLLDLEKKYVGKNVIRGIGKSAVAEAAPFIVYVALCAAVELMRRNEYFVPKVCVEALDQWHRDADWVGEWVRLCTIPTERPTTAGELARIAANEWGKARGHFALSGPMFGARLKEHASSKHTNRGTFYNLRVLSTAEVADEDVRDLVDSGIDAGIVVEQRARISNQTAEAAIERITLQGSMTLRGKNGAS